MMRGLIDIMSLIKEYLACDRCIYIKKKQFNRGKCCKAEIMNEFKEKKPAKNRDEANC